PEKFKEIYKNRDKNSGIDNINITIMDNQKYSSEDYIKLRNKNVKSININEDTVWTMDKSPYYVCGEVKVNKGAALTIEEGVKIYFVKTAVYKDRSGILVDGNLIINGTSANKVTMEPLDAASPSGSWKGIYVTENGNVTINNTIIDRAGSWTSAGIYSMGTLTIKDSTISNISGNGVTSFSDTDIVNTNFADNSGYGIDVYDNCKNNNIKILSNNFSGNDCTCRLVFRKAYSPSFNIGGNTAAGNNINAFKMYGDINGNMNFTSPGNNIPYVIVRRNNIDGTPDFFTVDENASVSFNNSVVKVEDTEENNNIKNKIQVYGTINLNGTASEHTVLTSANDHSVCGDSLNQGSLITPAINDWEGIYVDSKGTINADYADVAYAKYAIVSANDSNIKNSSFKNCMAGVYTEKNLIINDCAFDNLYAYGFCSYLRTKDAAIDVKNNVFSNIDGYVGKMIFSNSGSINTDISGNQAYNNKFSGVELSGKFSSNTNITSFGNNIPYITSNITIFKNVNFNIGPGTMFKINTGKLFGEKSSIICYGNLKANGSSEAQVIFTSLKDDSYGGDTNGDGNLTAAAPGDWGSISLLCDKNEEVSNDFENVAVSYGGDSNRGYEIGGSGPLIINNSIIKNSSENGILTSGRLVLQSSTIQDNLKTGLNIINIDGFKADINNNTFKDNHSYAAFANFQSLTDELKCMNNSAAGNYINGFGLEGSISGNITLGPVGIDFPYVIPDLLNVAKDSSLTLNQGTTTKLNSTADFNIYGKLYCNGIESEKVIFTSLKDDKYGGDTNNNSDGSGPAKGDWIGIDYKGGSEAIFNYSGSYYAAKNINLEKVTHLKVYNEGNSKVGVSEGKSIFTRPADNGTRISLYDFNLHNDILIDDDNGLSKGKPVIKGNYAAWIEGSSVIKIYDITKASIIKSIDAPNVRDIYLNDDYILWTEPGKLDFINIITGTGNKSITDTLVVDDSVKPVITSRYLIYKSTDDTMRKIDLDTGMEYYMLGKYNFINNMDTYGSELAFSGRETLASDNSDISVADLDTWKMKNVSFSYGISNSAPSLDKDNIAYVIASDETKDLVIANSSYLDNTPTVLALGYNFYDKDLSGSNLAFTSDGLVYNLNTNLNSLNNEFVSETADIADGYKREMEFGTDFKAGIGLEAGTEGVAVDTKSSISFNNDSSAKLSLIIDKDKLNNTLSIGVGREKIEEYNVKGEFSAGLLNDDNFIGDYTNIVSSSASVSDGRLVRGRDEYHYIYNDHESYNKIGGLILAGMLKNNVNPGYPSTYINHIIANYIEGVSGVNDNPLSYSKSGGVGITLAAEGNLSIVQAELNAQGVAETSKEYNKDKSTDYYNSLEIEMSGSISLAPEIKPKNCSIEIEGFMPEDIEYLKYFQKIPSIVLAERSCKLFYKAKYNKETNTLVIIIRNESDDENGYFKTYTYTLRGLDVNTSDFQNLIDLNNNSTGSGFSWTEISNISDKMNSVVQLLKQSLDIEYEVELTKKITDKTLNIKVSTDKLPFVGILPKVDIGVGGSYDENIKVVIDRGKLSNGQLISDKQSIYFVPIKEEGLIETIKNVFAGIATEISPQYVNFENGEAVFSKDGNTAAVSAPVNYSNASFISVPLNYEQSQVEKVVIDSNQEVLQRGIFLKLFDNNGEVVNDITGTVLKLNIDTAKLGTTPIDNCVIYEFDEISGKWIKRGGRVDKTNHTISMDLDHNGQYAVGIDKSQPLIMWKVNNTDFFGGQVSNDSTMMVIIQDSDITGNTNINIQLTNSKGENVPFIPSINYNEGGCEFQVPLTWNAISISNSND
ncbi:MAG: right-handed parallel beta-helix repeat-containing protein, partial [Bacillota bacterium]|nr:right-handed parallel beta-helix repeat-containing protein [Bacillota bacterium]